MTQSSLSRLLTVRDFASQRRRHPTRVTFGRTGVRLEGTLLLRRCIEATPQVDGQRVREASADVIEPSGAFYLYVRVGEATPENPEPGTAFAQRLLDNADVAVVPGVAFRSPEWVRVSYAAPAKDVLEGVRRIISAGIS